MALPNNNLEKVVTYQASSLAYLLNLNCLVSTANTQFKDFEKREANLGDYIDLLSDKAELNFHSKAAHSYFYQLGYFHQLKNQNYDCIIYRPSWNFLQKHNW